MRNTLFALCFLMITSPAFAGGGGAAKPAAEPSMDVPPFMAPFAVNGELQGYIYIVVKLDLTSDFKKPVVLDKIPYLQDAFLRHVHQHSIVSAQDPTKVDEAALAERLKPVAEKILGPDVVAKVSFRTVTKAAN
jgi:hypothetical protein